MRSELHLVAPYAILPAHGTASFLAAEDLDSPEQEPVLWLSGVRRIVTRDTDFHRFPFLETVDPVT